MSDGAVVVATLIRARRRLIAATFMQFGCMALAAGVAGVVLVSLVTSRPFAVTRPLLAVGALALAVGAVVTTWRRPTLAQTASAIDRRMGLSDLAVAAHALRDSQHPMAQLVVRDARQRLTAAALSRVLPMPRQLATWTSGSSVAALLLGMLVGGGGAPTGSLVPAGGAGRVVSGGSARARSEAAASAAATELVTGARAEAAPAARAGGTPDAATPSPEAQAAPSTVAARRSQAGARGAASPADAQGQTAGRSGNAGRGASAPQATPGAAAGGVQQGTLSIRTLSAARPSTRTSSTDAPPTTEDLRQATRRAEAALARDEIPPRMKPLVRRYFQSIQSAPGR